MSCYVECCRSSQDYSHCEPMPFLARALALMNTESGILEDGILEEQELALISNIPTVASVGPKNVCTDELAAKADSEHETLKASCSKILAGMDIEI